MIIKLLGTIIVLVLFAFFTGFNLSNKCDVNILFYKFQQVPVFFTIIVSFVCGIIFTIPFIFIHKNSKKSEAPNIAKNIINKEQDESNSVEENNELSDK